MSKEIKVGLAIVGALGVALVSMTAMRMRAKQNAPVEQTQDAQQALAALKEEKAKLGGEPEKPSLFSLGDSTTPAATEPAAEPATEHPHHERRDPFNMNANATPAETNSSPPMVAQAADAPSALVGDRYSAPAALTAEERREEKREERKEKLEEKREEAAAAAGDPIAAQQVLERQEMRAADPFQQGGQAPMNNPLATNSSAFSPPPQATLADGIAPAGDQAPVSPYGTPPMTDPLMRSAGDVRLDPNPDTSNPAHQHHHDKRAGETLQTAGEAPVAGDSRYEYRGGQKANPHQAAELARERAVMNEMRREDDRYSPRKDPATPATTPQYDIYGRDIRAERQDPPAAAPVTTMPDTSVGRLGEDPLGRRTDNLAPDGTDAPPVDGKYRVAPGDNFWTISQKVYGNGSYFKALEEHNRERFPYSDKLPVNQEVRVPPLRELEAQYPDLCPRSRRPGAEGGADAGAMNVSTREGRGRTYKVQEGDTLFDIARDQLGKAARWNEIYDLNRAQLGNDFNFLAPGTELILPENRPSRDPLTTQARQPRTR